MLDEIIKYESETKKSSELHKRATKIFPGGINHNIRYWNPYPIYIKRGKGSKVWDVDGNEYIDMWMVHMSAILGHAHPSVIAALKDQLPNSLHLGTVNEKAIELAELIQDFVPSAEMVRLGCSGTEATLYAVRLARAYTKKRMILKAEGGWHGGNETLHLAVTYPYEISESSGILNESQKYTKVVPFNNIEGTIKAINENRKDLAGMILEPMLGAGGGIPASKEYLREVKSEIEKQGAIFIADEVITGFRFPKCAQGYYGIIPHLTTLGKALGGGLPIGAVCGQKELMELATPGKGAWIGGGTFSGNTASVTTGIAMLQFLKSHPAIYEKIDGMGKKLRKEIDSIFKSYGICTQTTGIGSFLLTHFSFKPSQRIISGRAAWENADPKKRFEYYLRLINEGVFFIPGHAGAVSVAHTDEDINHILKATRRIAERMEKGK
jgi:glutamate-1-semialdehyde 2,1-aminomutase